ncbi:MAG: prepilin peptidase [Candidatus Omnitrophica bacterium]|nr:prepilin peptidase [Candidatus Omnitrophota bacterium]
MAPLAFLPHLAFFSGLIAGSFLNVCIWRLPREEQVVRGRSHCTDCKKTIEWYDNIPVASFLLLRGRCRQCKKAISWRYPAVELSTGIAFFWVVSRWGLTGVGLTYLILMCGLIVVTVIDAREQIIPFAVTQPGIVVGLAASLLLPQLQGVDHRGAALLNSALGVFAGGGAIYVMAVFGEMIFKREAMGGGDVWFMAMLGAFLGWQKVLLIFFLAPIFGSIVGVPLKFRRGAEVIPYGPFLSMAAVIAVGWGDAILSWYFKSLGGF